MILQSGGVQWRKRAACRPEEIEFDTHAFIGTLMFDVQMIACEVDR